MLQLSFRCLVWGHQWLQRIWIAHFGKWFKEIHLKLCLDTFFFPYFWYFALLSEWSFIHIFVYYFFIIEKADRQCHLSCSIWRLARGPACIMYLTLLLCQFHVNQCAFKFRLLEHFETLFKLHCFSAHCRFFVFCKQEVCMKIGDIFWKALSGV